MSGTYIDLPVIGGGSAGVTSLNGLSGVLTLVAGSNITITPSGTSITIASTGGGGAVSSVTNSDGTLTISPTTGSVVASLTLSNANSWTGLQTFGNHISFGGATVNVSTLTSGQVLTYNGTNWINAAPATSGTVTSVALTAPAIFSVAGSPITSSGTLAITSNTQSANLVYAGPSTGSPAIPTFRSLVSADIPSLSYVTSVAATATSTIFSITGSPITSSGTLAFAYNSNTLPIANGGTNISGYTTGDILYASSATTLSKLGIGSSGQVLTISSGIPSWMANVGITQLTGDVTAGPGSGSQASTVAKIQGTVVSGTTGTGNVVFSASPTFSGTATFTSGTTISTNIVAIGTVTGSNLSGTNTGDVTLGSANGLSIATGQILSLALSSTVNTGALSSVDWNTFNNKQSALTFANSLVNTTGTVTLVNDGTPTASQYYGTNSGSTLGYYNLPGGGGSGTVTSVALTMPAIFSVGGSPITTSGTLAVTLATETANTVWAGPTSGGAATPTFRALVSADIPSLSSIYLPLAGGTMSGAINMGTHQINAVTDPTSAQDAATKNYVDTAVAGLQPLASVYAATVGSNIAGTYSNGVGGIGATFTTTSTSTFTLDGTTPPVGSRILIKDQSSGFQNGVYGFTTAPVGGVSGAIFTRTLDYDTASDMNSAGLIPVINGTLNALSSWQQVATITTVGTDALVFSEFTANPSLYLLKANNLSDVTSKSTSYNNLSPTTTTGDLAYANGSGTNTRLAVGSTGNVLTVSGGVPTWAPPATSGTVTAVSVASANGFAGSSSGGATPSLTISTSITGILSGNGTAISAAGTTGTGSTVVLETNPQVNAATSVAQTYAPSGGGTATVNLALSNINYITMPAGNVTIALSNDSNNQVFMINITQDSVGSRTVTWFTTIRWASGGTAPTLTTAANKRDCFGFVRTGSGTYDGFVIGQNI